MFVDLKAVPEISVQLEDFIRPVAELTLIFMHLLKVMQFDVRDLAGHEAVLEKIQFISLRPYDQLKLLAVLLIQNWNALLSCYQTVRVSFWAIFDWNDC